MLRVQHERTVRRRASRLIPIVAIAVLVALAAPAVAGSRGELTSAFHNELNQFKRDDFAGTVRPKGHISPFGPGPLQVCDALVVGTWYALFGEDRAELADTAAEFRLDGELLTATRTPPKKTPIPGDGPGWAIVEGVPVIGTLDPGTHTLEYIFNDGFEVGIEVDSSSDHC